MKVDKNRTIGGVPLTKVRDLLRYMGAGRGGSGRTMTRKEIADRVGLDIADELIRERLLALKKGRDGKPWYELTHAAVRLVALALGRLLHSQVVTLKSVKARPSLVL
jgi:hypothetical protein